MTFEKEVEALAPLMSFDPSVFRGNAEVPQSVCNLVLALAVAYNDIRDVSFGFMLLEVSRPHGDPRPTRAFGQFGGVRTTLEKALFGVIHETLALIKREDKAISHPFFCRVVTSCSPEARRAWESIVSAAKGEEDALSPTKALMLMRNKVAFHYDAKEIHRAFEICFPSHDDAPEPYVSAGDSMRSTRFYFADRCVEWYLEHRVSPSGEPLGPKAADMYLKPIGLAFYEIVTKFVPNRRFAWRPRE